MEVCSYKVMNEILTAIFQIYQPFLTIYRRFDKGYRLTNKKRQKKQEHIAPVSQHSEKVLFGEFI